MEGKFYFERAKQAIDIVIRLNVSGNVDDKLNEAKKVYDFLVGRSCHLVENDDKTPIDESVQFYI